MSVESWLDKLDEIGIDNLQALSLHRDNAPDEVKEHQDYIFLCGYLGFAEVNNQPL